MQSVHLVHNGPERGTDSGCGCSCCGTKNAKSLSSGKSTHCNSTKHSTHSGGTTTFQFFGIRHLVSCDTADKDSKRCVEVPDLRNVCL